MRRTIQFIERLSLWGASLSAVFLSLIVLIIAVEIVLRSVFNTSTLIADEYSAYFFVGVVLLGLGFTLKEGAHIRITLVTSLVGERANQVLNIMSTLAAIAITTFALYHTSIMVFESWQLDMTADTISETPIFLSQMVIPAGLAMFDLQLAANFLKRFL
ncbi:TRAP-type C4-dicarboxylate transport system, small permease component [Desulforapulum autotrophicum HRM2]|jgi:TRAP-type C4-dicarboxylate transport system permease small subunit|uniref:TRAP-type C4-dicarboxylate transport system, small permease component n=1 Tax=Desulforapulum autotrophicum (strain ATCC 43914 / DSM 3382 / VKM B-1955 / HRM2) TaxID=177437 RepID=C0QGE2_DESAH|nr:TRAP-type C4-dicarboxylate transport system, small permease component [Desulforapulum autotrophicum HRM2]